MSCGFKAFSLVLLLCLVSLGASSRLCARVKRVASDNGFDQLHSFGRARTEILFQVFTWDASVHGQKHVWYRHLRQKAPELAAIGVTHVWFPPPSRSVSAQGYLPSDWYDLGSGEQLGHNRTLYGTREELRDCVKTFQEEGMFCLCDVVLNHRCASHQEDGIWNVFHHPSGKAIWEKWALAAGDYGGTGAPDTGGDFGAAPDLDHANQAVRADVIAWLRWLRTDLGFDGWRFDYSKGYAPRYTRTYILSTGPLFAVGEYWTDMAYNGSQLLPNQDAHRQALCDWLDASGSTCRAFDFTTKGVLQEALRRGEFWRLRSGQGRATGLLGWWPDRAVTFIDNHDTGASQNHWPFPEDKVLAGYAYILTHPGIPTIFWDHLYEWGRGHREIITALARLRYEFGINRRSSLSIVTAQDGLYVARIDDVVVLRLGSGNWQPGSGWSERVSGADFCVWSRDNGSR